MAAHHGDHLAAGREAHHADAAGVDAPFLGATADQANRPPAVPQRVLGNLVRRVVLAGQAMYSKAEYEHIRTTGTNTEEDPPPDPAKYLASATRLIALRPRRVYFSHDRAVWNASY